MRTTDPRFYKPEITIFKEGTKRDRDGYKYVMDRIGNNYTITCYDPKGKFSHVVKQGYDVSKVWQDIK